MKKLPAEIVASALAVTTIFITLLPYHLPAVGHLHHLGRHVCGRGSHTWGAA